MTRTVSATISTAVAQATTKPVYLIYMAWATPVRSCTWGANIAWNSQTWVASGIEVSNLDASGGSMELPLGDADPWLALVLADLPRNRAIDIYEYHTNATASPVASDAVLLFSGFMDEAQIGQKIRVNLIEATQRKGFPAGRIDRPTYNYLLAPGTRIQWGIDTVMVN